MKELKRKKNENNDKTTTVMTRINARSVKSVQFMARILSSAMSR